MSSQRTVDVHHEDTVLQARGRHDPCVLPRAVPMVGAMATLVLADHALRQEAVRGGAPPPKD
jgi:chorismate synthase